MNVVIVASCEKQHGQALVIVIVIVIVIVTSCEKQLGQALILV